MKCTQCNTPHRPVVAAPGSTRHRELFRRCSNCGQTAEKTRRDLREPEHEMVSRREAD